MTAVDDLRVYRKRLHYRAWHRGTREADLILGRFADAFLAQSSRAEMQTFARILEYPDHDILRFVRCGGDHTTDEDEKKILKSIRLLLDS